MERSKDAAKTVLEALVPNILAGVSNDVAAEILQAVDMMGVPVSKMFDLPVLVFDFPKNLLLVFAVLKKTDRRPARLRPGFNNTGDVNV